MKLTLNDVKQEDRELLSPCGIICAGCDVYTHESAAAAKRIIAIWEGFNLADVAVLAGLNSEEVLTTIDTLRRFVKHRETRVTCRGCYGSGGPFRRCPIWKCVTSKGYWTCAECDEYDPGSEHPCPYSETNHPDVPLSSKGTMSALVCKRYQSHNTNNLRTCREIGYPAFIEAVKEQIRKGWRTWQVINDAEIFS